MSIDLSKFHDKAVSSISIEGEVDEQKIDFNGRQIKLLKPIEYDGEIYRVDGEKILHLNIFYRYEEACGRCLEHFKDGNKTTLTAKLSMETENIEGEEEEDVIYYIEDQLDLKDYIINTVILSLPMKPLCSEECKGLCPKCGANYNQLKCNCVIKDVDPRLEKLKNFFPDE